MNKIHALKKLVAGMADKLPPIMERFKEKKKFYNTMDALIVDDEMDICFLLTGMFKKRNMQTMYVNSIHEANDILVVEQPSILVLDNNLPDGQGIDLIHDLKTVHPAMGIILITADDTPANKKKAFNAGVDFFIGKPFTLDTMNNTIDRMIAAAR